MAYLAFLLFVAAIVGHSWVCLFAAVMFALAAWCDRWAEKRAQW